MMWLLGLMLSPVLAWAQQPVYEIRGQVVHSVTGTPVAKATIWVAEPLAEHKRLASMVTGADGRFRLGGLPAGKYTLVVERLGFLHQHYAGRNLVHGHSSAIVVGPGAATDALRFALVPSSVIHGYVHNQAGEPAAGLLVAALRVNGSGARRQAAPLGRATSDDRGYFRIHSLPAGNFVVAAEGQLSWELSDYGKRREECYPATYHPDAAEGGAAGEVQVAPGEEARADITVRLAPAVDVRMNLALPTEGGKAYAWLTTAGPFGAEMGSGGSVAINEGRANFGLRAAGRYRLHVRQGDAMIVDREVDVRETDQTMDVPFVPMCRVKAQVTVHGGGEVEAGRMVLALVPDGAPHAFNRAVEPDGSVVLPAVSAGRYLLRISTPRAAAILSVEARGARFRDGAIDIPETGEVGLSVIVDGTAAAQPGMVYRDGKPAAGLLVILAPKAREAEVTAYRFDQSDSDGSFTWYGVPKGEYWALTVEEGIDLDYADAELLRPLLKGAQTVTVGEGKRGPVRLDYVPPKKNR